MTCDHFTCDHCKTKIEQGGAYSVTEYGRLHSKCLREVAYDRIVLGPGKGAEEKDPIYVRERGAWGMAAQGRAMVRA
jgi:hypothetical protein